MSGRLGRCLLANKKGGCTGLLPHGRYEGKAMKKRRTGLLAVCMAVLLTTGCGGADSSSQAMSDRNGESWSEEVSYDTGSVEMGGGYYETTEEPSEAFSGENGQVWTDRKLIKNVNLEVETKEYDAALAALEARIQELGGYIENMDSYNGSSYSGYRSSRYANLTIRIPQEKLDAFLNAVADSCNVVRRSDSVEDVTISYVDMESRRDALRTEHTRLLELLEQAETLEDVLTIEDRLTTVRYQLESMESKLRAMDNQVQYSTVYLDITEVKELTPVETEEETAWQRISQGFMDSLRGIGHGISEFGIWFLIHLPQLVIWAAVIAAVVLLIRRRRKKKAERKAAKEEERKAS